MNFKAPLIKPEFKLIFIPRIDRILKDNKIFSFKVHFLSIHPTGTNMLISKMLSMSKIGWYKEWVVRVGNELEKSSFWSPKAKRNKLTTRACTPRIPLIRPSWRSRSWLTSCQFLQEWCLQELTPSVIKWPWKLEPMSAVKVERQSKYALTILSLRSPLWLRPKYCFIFITMNL